MPVILMTPNGVRTSIQDSRLKDITTAVRETSASGVVIVGMKDTDPIEWVCEIRRCSDPRLRDIPIAIVRSIDELQAAIPDGQLPQWHYDFPPLSQSAARAEVPGKLIIDQRAREVLVRGDRRTCSPQEFRLLLLFLRFPSVMFSREELSWRVCGDQKLSDHRLVDVLVSRIRRKIEVEGVPAGQIWTARKLGYAFTYNERRFVDAITGESFLAWPNSGTVA